MPEAERTGFVRTILLTHGHCNSGWLRTGREVGITDEALQEMVLEKLRVTECRSKYGINGFIRDFMDYGFGHYGRPTNPDFLGWFDEEWHSYWHLLTRDQFIEAIQIILAKWPEMIFDDAHYRHIITRLAEAYQGGNTERKSKATADAVPFLDYAAAQLERLGSVRNQTFRQLSVERRIDLLRTCITHHLLILANHLFQDRWQINRTDYQRHDKE